MLFPMYTDLELYFSCIRVIKVVNRIALLRQPFVVIALLLHKTSKVKIVVLSCFLAIRATFVAILWQLPPPMLQYYKFSTVPKWMTGNFSYVVSFFFNNKLQQTNRETAEICYTTGVFPMRLDNSNESKGGACVFLQRKRQISEPGKS